MMRLALARSLVLILLACMVGLTGCTSDPMTAKPPAVPNIGSMKSVHDTSTPRTGAMVLGGVSIVAAASAIGFSVAGQLEESKIRDGDFATGREIADAGSRGQTYNNLAFATGAIAFAAFGATIGLWLYRSDSGSRTREPEKRSALKSFLRRGAFEL